MTMCCVCRLGFHANINDHNINANQRLSTPHCHGLHRRPQTSAITIQRHLTLTNLDNPKQNTALIVQYSAPHSSAFAASIMALGICRLKQRSPSLHPYFKRFSIGGWSSRQCLWIRTILQQLSPSSWHFKNLSSQHYLLSSRIEVMIDLQSCFKMHLRRAPRPLQNVTEESHLIADQTEASYDENSNSHKR